MGTWEGQAYINRLSHTDFLPALYCNYKYGSIRLTVLLEAPIAIMLGSAKLTKTRRGGRRLDESASGGGGGG